MNNTSIVTQVVIAVAGVLTPAICLYVANLIKKYIPNKSLLQALEQFAKDAVVLAEKAGLTDKLLDKKQYAINKLQDMLQQAGSASKMKIYWLDVLNMLIANSKRILNQYTKWIVQIVHQPQ